MHLDTTVLGRDLDDVEMVFRQLRLLQEAIKLLFKQLGTLARLNKRQAAIREVPDVVRNDDVTAIGHDTRQGEPAHIDSTALIVG